MIVEIIAAWDASYSEKGKVLAAAGYLIKTNVDVHGQLRSCLEKSFFYKRREINI